MRAGPARCWRSNRRPAGRIAASLSADLDRDGHRTGICPGLYWRLRYHSRSPLAYGNPSLIAGLSMESESLNERVASNLSGRQVSGRCLCGAVELEIDFPAFWAWHDHSAASRHAHGAAYATYIGCWRKHVRVAKGRRSIARFEDAKTESSRSFCSRCGTPLLYERKRSPHMVNIPRALFTGRYRPRATL